MLSLKLPPSPCAVLAGNLILSNHTLDDFGRLSSLTDEEVLEVGYVLRELRYPSARERGAIADALGNNHPQPPWRYLARFKVPALLPMQGRMTTSPLPPTPLLPHLPT